MELKYRAYNLKDESYAYGIEKVGAQNQRVRSNFSNEYISTTKESFYDFITDLDYEVEQYTGIKDNRGEDIYEGDIVLPVRILRIPKEFISDTQLSHVLTSVGDCFTVSKGNYVEGKWIARMIEDTGYGVTDHYESYELIVVGNVHYDEELLVDRHRAEKKAKSLVE